MFTFIHPNVISNFFSPHPQKTLNFTKMNAFKCKSYLQKIFLESVAAVNPIQLIRKTLKVKSGKLYVKEKPYDITKNIYLVGFGKAVLGMACESEKILSNHLKAGIICVPENIQETFSNKPEFQLKKNSAIKIFEGAKNNLPDENAEKGADAILDMIKKIDKNDILLVLISGGGSSLLPKPKGNITLSEKFSTIKLLASAGADINEVNTVRKRLSAVKGGKLAELTYPTRTIALILSDVISNPLDIIASGPTMPNLDSKNAACEIIKKYELVSKVPKSVLDACEDTPLKSNVPIENNNYTHVSNHLIGHNDIAIAEGKKCAENLGFKTVVLSNKIDGIAGNVADFYAELSFEICSALQNHNLKNFSIKLSDILQKYEIQSNSTFNQIILEKIKESKDSSGLCIISGGETTVLIKGTGKGGRNQELALKFSERIYNLRKNSPSVFDNFAPTILSAGTDGIDGPTDVAGAIGSADLIDLAFKNGIDSSEFLRNNDSYNFFNRVDGGSYFIKTGHTGTNVMDLHVLLICNLKKNLSHL